MIEVNVKFVPGEYCNADVIPNTLSYIFNLKSKNPLPVRFYGLSDVGGYPPSHEKIIQQFQKIRADQNNTSTQQVWHMILSFPCLFEEPYGTYFYFADAIAKVFAYEYPVCYAYHTKNKTTGNAHSHFHYIISTSSYIPEHPPLDESKMQAYFNHMQEAASLYGILLQIQQ